MGQIHTPEFYTDIKIVIDTFEHSSVIFVGGWNIVLIITLNTQNYRGEHDIAFSHWQLHYPICLYAVNVGHYTTHRLIYIDMYGQQWQK